jgi:aspartyl protease family protein
MVLVALFVQYKDHKYFKPGEVPMAVQLAKVPEPPKPKQVSASRSVTLQSDSRGHFQVEARVDGRAVDFLVDTGASGIALRESSANRVGIFPRQSDYTVPMQTANGTGKAARVMLNRIDVNGIAVYNIPAFVVPDENLSVNLLGMTFLSSVKWTHNNGRLVLEQ